VGRGNLNHPLPGSGRIDIQATNLVPLVEKYNLETVQQDGWVPEAFLDVGNPFGARGLTSRCNTSTSLLNLQ